MDNRTQGEIPDFSFLEKSEKYQAGLEQARESKDQQEAKLFRMEVMLDNAKLTRLLFELIEKNPEASIEDLRQAARQSDLVAHPAVVEIFISNLNHNRKLVKQAIGEFKKIDEKYHVGLGKVVYEWVLPSDAPWPRKPIGNIILDSSYPLALTVYIENEEDFTRIDPRQNVGGFYQYNQKYSITTDSPIELTAYYPFICISGPPPKALEDPREWLDTQKLFEHETGHSQNYIYSDSLVKYSTTEKSSRRKTIWGSLEFVDQAVVKELEQIHFKEGKEKAKKSPFWRIIISYALAQAKDELLANYSPARGYLEGKLLDLQEKDGLYDFFAHHLSISESSELYRDLWDEYMGILEEAIKPVNRIIEAYKNCSLDERVELFRWVLAQLPLKQWRDRLSNTLFFREAVKLNQIRKNNYNPALRAPYQNASPSFKALMRDIQQHQTEPLLPYIERIKSGIDFKNVVSSEQSE